MDHSRQPTAGSRRPAPVPGPARSLASAAVLGTRVHAAAGMTAVTAIRETLTIPGQYDQLRAARVFTRTALTEHHPCAAVAALLVSDSLNLSICSLGVFCGLVCADRWDSEVGCGACAAADLG